MNNWITIEELKEKDLCFGFPDDEYLYDYSLLSDFIDHTQYVLESCKDDINYKVKKYMTKVKSLIVWRKDFFNFSPCRLKETLMSYGEDNFGTSYDDYKTYLSDKAENLINELCEEVNKHNTVYHAGTMVGFIDLSEEVEKHLKIENYEVENEE